MKARDILKLGDRSGLLIKKNCRTIDEELYERLYRHPRGERYRRFFTDDDYDYITDPFTIKLLDVYFKHTKR